jgi:hypothetical protein
MADTGLDEHQAAVYEIAGRRYDLRTTGFPEAIARAHASQQRPRCTCVPGGIETYVAKLHDGYVVKRMPETGNQHASSCPHFEPAADASGLRPLLGTAIREDPVSGLTTLRLDFAMSRSAQRQASMPSATTAPSSARNDQRLSLRGLLLYLWEQAGLTRWQPGFAGKRPWATVRRRLLQAAGNKIVGGRPLVDRLYVPEPFNVNDREGISRRRSASWNAATAGQGSSGRLLLLIGELKEIAPARCGFKAVVKQVPDLVFTVEDRLYHQITRRLQPELALWNAADDIRMLMIATFGTGPSGVPTILDLALVPTTRDWLPVKDVFEHQLVERLVAENRSFLKGAHLDPRSPGLVPCATLIDCSKTALELFVLANANPAVEADSANGRVTETRWAWHVAEGPIPALPWL